MRPTLPRRQLQIPRFSPLAAWKSLSPEISLITTNECLNSNFLSSNESKFETRIERVYRISSFNLQHVDNKSGDSGISADKEIGNSPDTSKIPQAYLASSWIPQQDLEDDEESVTDREKMNFAPKEIEQQFTNGHMFSLSLPRDNLNESNNVYCAQKLQKKTVDSYDQNLNSFTKNSNWYLGSQPNSIDESISKKETGRSQIISQMTRGKHVMYLPTNSESFESNQKLEVPIRVPSNEIDHEHNHQNKISESKVMKSDKKKSKSNRFNFQSTIRQNQMKKIAEKLSKEAEEKELRRLTELEAMQKVYILFDSVFFFSFLKLIFFNENIAYFAY